MYCFSISNTCRKLDKNWQPTHIHVLFLCNVTEGAQNETGNLHIYMYCFNKHFDQHKAYNHWQPTHIHVLFPGSGVNTKKSTHWQPTHIHVLFQQNCTNVGLSIL